MHYIEEILEKLRDSYPVYIGRKSLDTLMCFISGYELAVQEITGDKDSFFFRMDVFVHQKYDIIPLHSKNWVTLLTERAGSDEAAFDLFYELRDEMKQTGYVTKPREELEKTFDAMIAVAMLRGDSQGDFPLSRVK